MVDVTVTEAEVLPGTDTVYVDGLFGATITGGQLVYLDATTATYKLADTDVDAATALAVGIAMIGGVSAQPCKIAVGGSLDPGFTVGVGEVYVVSGTAGGIAPVADLANGDFTMVVGIGVTASSLKLVFKTAGVAKA